VIKRPLSVVESTQAQLVFGRRLALEEVRVYENAGWPLVVGRLAAAFRHRPPPPANAVTLGMSIFFSRALRISLEDDPPDGSQDMAWLVHELAHVWQFRQMGWGYLPKALEAFFRHGPRAYDYGGAAGLMAAGREGRHLLDFNPEQQGEIARDYYLRLRAHLDLGPWEGFVAELREP